LFAEGKKRVCATLLHFLGGGRRCGAAKRSTGKKRNTPSVTPSGAGTWGKRGEEAGKTNRQCFKKKKNGRAANGVIIRKKGFCKAFEKRGVGRQGWRRGSTRAR